MSQVSSYTFGLASNSNVRFSSLTAAGSFFLVVSLSGAPTKFLGFDLPFD
jgi:hypothetical protein